MVEPLNRFRPRPRQGVSAGEAVSHVLFLAGAAAVAVYGYAQCLQFNALLAGLLDRLEDGGHDREARKVMALLLDRSPREGARCEKSTAVGERVRKL